ncbi:MAG: hypothetical protein JST54_20425 [Deltaproteobacteria bacterium]|nr:hypothetical protein [Deltaproteobacteria bacterium]
MERPLSATERAMFHLDKLSTLNFSTVGRVRGPLTLERVQQGVEAAAKRHMFLRSRIELDALGNPWFREGGAIPGVRFVSGAEWIPDAEREVNEPISASTGPLVRVVHVQHAADDHTLILNFHHSVGDGWSGVYLLRDIVQAASGQALEQLPDVVGVDERFPAPERGFGGFLGLLRFGLRELWLSLRHGVPVGARRDSPALAHQRRSRVIPKVLEAELAARLAERARAEQTTVHGALAAAIMLATVADTELGRAGKPVRVGFGSPVNLRTELTPPVGEELGMFVSMLAWGGAVRPSDDFWSLARAIRASTVLDKARGFVWAALRAMSVVFAALGGAAAPKEKMAARWEKALPATSGLTNLGRLGIETRFGDLQIAEAHFLTCPSALGVWLSTATSLHGRLFWNFVYTDPSLSPEHARALAEDAVTRLERAVGAMATSEPKSEAAA